MTPIDQWALQQLQKLIAGVHEAYEGFMFHRVFSLIYQFCTVQMSSIYMDVLKDRMYCEAPASPVRRSAQTVMYRILDALIRMLAPILAHTAEEAWAAMPYKSEDVKSVHLAGMAQVDPGVDWQGQEALWDRLMALRDDILRALEGLRQDKQINSNQEASVLMQCTDEDAAVIERIGTEHFAALCIVSEITLEKGAPATTVTVSKCQHNKCQRCWNYWPSVGSQGDYQNLCQRCTDVVQQAAR
jgi:isoleucyl-tRNA synthetase